MIIKTDAKVDIILPNYNKSQFIEETINSIKSQTYKRWNLLIIDDKSKDNSKEILKKHECNNIKTILLPKNKGVSFCRNLGMRLSNSDYIAFIDADDYWSDDKLNTQISFMDKFNYDFTYTDYVPFIEKNNKKIFKKKVETPDSFKYEQFINNTSIAMSSMIIRRSVLGFTRFHKLKICEDYSFKCEILKKNNIAFRVNKSSMFYRITKNSKQSNKLRNLYWVWHINKNYNDMSFFKNLKSVFFIILSSIKRYGIK
tara:strand:+ start:3095 stop:3862 length:768 start_codon:yes stop_codon:yes gene_type:complete